VETHTLGEFHGTRLHDVTADGEGAAATQRGVEHRAVRPLEVDCRVKPRVRPGGLESISTLLYYVDRRTRVYIRVELTIFSSFARLNPKSLGGLGRANLSAWGAVDRTSVEAELRVGHLDLAEGSVDDQLPRLARCPTGGGQSILQVISQATALNVCRGSLRRAKAMMASSKV
jgi:hypothetical protein